MYNASSPREPMPSQKHFLAAAVLCISFAFAPSQAPAQQSSKPKLTLDEFFNSVSYDSVEISPDGKSVIIGTERADWDQSIFRKDLWLYRDGKDKDKDKDKDGSLIQLTQSGHDSEAKWSPNGDWIAFLSERKSPAEKSGDADSDDGDKKDKDDKDEGTTRVYLISPNGGEAFPITEGAEDVHAFAWSADSKTIYFATRQPWAKAQKDDYKKEWKDVVQYRAAERGDTVFALDVAAAVARHAAAPAHVDTDSDKEKEDLSPGAQPIATTPLRVDQLVTSPDGRKLAFVTNSINQRQEKYEDTEIYEVDLNVARAPCPRLPAVKQNQLSLAVSRIIRPSKAICAGPATAATSFSPSKSATSPVPTAISSRISTGLTLKQDRQSIATLAFGWLWLMWVR